VPLASLATLLTGGTGGSLAPKGSFAGGGPIESATIGLIGEAGAELVIPNWLYSDPKQANLMGFLEATIASKGNAFATGGSTTGASAVAASPGADESLEEGGQLVALVQQLVKSHEEFRDEITTWQRELNLDPRRAKRAIEMVTQVQTGGGIR
jgi:uncharacterized membrane protein YeaQ/YmgE (transglycosylase-associated protein family)